MHMYTAQGQFVEYFEQRCGDVKDRQQCSGSCKWENDECVPICDSLGKDACKSYNTCEWNDKNASCGFAQRRCSSFNKKECNDEYDCKWLHEECVQNCNSYDRGRCTADSSCEWDKQDCFFKNKRCRHKSTEECNARAECAWKDEDCVPRCDVFDKNRCDAYRACSWNGQNGGCTIANRSCSKIDTLKECNSHSECGWKKNECFPRCDLFDKPRCDTYKDCLWNAQRDVCGFKET